MRGVHACVAVGLLLLASSCAQANEAPVVTTAHGAVGGRTASDVESFKGIPFAQPPVGDLRWRAPQSVKAWSGVRPAVEYAQDCMQTPVDGIAAPIQAPLSEDCLYLNVWRPAGTRRGAKLPVMVWIHGGGFVNGGSSPALFRGDAFARQGVIMVSINYRIGRFGFFAHPALSAANQDHGLLGNYGYLDQIFALGWVRDNIEQFGGDPLAVTIFGESAGGVSVHMLLTSPLARGLFARAIVQSGGGRGDLLGTRYLNRDNGTMPSLEAVGIAFAEAHGIPGNGAEALARLRALPAGVVDGGLNMRTLMAQRSTFGGPTTDGKIVTGSPDHSYRAGAQQHVPLLIGATSADIGIAQSKAQVFAAFGSHAEAARIAYDPLGTATDATLVSMIGGDLAMVEPARYVARLFALKGVPVWHFRFSYVADSVKERFPSGAPHASDIPFVMATVRDRYGSATTVRDEEMARIMNRYWANFARTGNPNGPGLPEWPGYDARADVLMEFAASGRAELKMDPRKKKLDLIEAAAATASAP